MSFVVSRLLYKTNSNNFQARMALEIHEEKDFHLISFGHTHIPSLIPISEDDYCFNTGCWKPIIYLFRHDEDYFFPQRPFNRIDRAGVFRVERDISKPGLPVRFSLLTLQNGTSGITS